MSKRSSSGEIEVDFDDEGRPYVHKVKRAKKASVDIAWNDDGTPYLRKSSSSSNSRKRSRSSSGEIEIGVDDNGHLFETKVKRTKKRLVDIAWNDDGTPFIHKSKSNRIARSRRRKSTRHRKSTKR